MTFSFSIYTIPGGILSEQSVESSKKSRRAEVKKKEVAWLMTNGFLKSGREILDTSRGFTVVINPGSESWQELNDRLVVIRIFPLVMQAEF